MGEKAKKRDQIGIKIPSSEVIPAVVWKGAKGGGEELR